MRTFDLWQPPSAYTSQHPSISATNECHRYSFAPASAVVTTMLLNLQQTIQHLHSLEQSSPHHHHHQCQHDVARKQSPANATTIASCSSMIRHSKKRKALGSIENAATRHSHPVQQSPVSSSLAITVTPSPTHSHPNRTTSQSSPANTIHSSESLPLTPSGPASSGSLHQRRDSLNVAVPPRTTHLHIDTNSSPAYNHAAAAAYSTSADLASASLFAHVTQSRTTQFSPNSAMFYTRNMTRNEELQLYDPEKTMDGGSFSPAFTPGSTTAAALRQSASLNSLSQHLISTSPQPSASTRKPSSAKVTVVHSARLAFACDIAVAAHQNRHRLYHALLQGYGLLDNPNVCVLPESLASFTDMTQYHDTEYIEFCKNHSAHTAQPTVDQAQAQRNKEYHLMYDGSSCLNLYSYMRLVAGATLTAVHAIAKQDAKIACAWSGGRHHAHADAADGFCWVNDVVLGILKLQDLSPSIGQRILYLDIDIHHGNGVEAAFEQCDSVYTVSFHHAAPGYYPQSGTTIRSSTENDKRNNLNVPLPAGVTDEQYSQVFTDVVSSVWQKFQPTCVVMCCGADTLSRDPVGVFNMTTQGVVDCVKYVMQLSGHATTPTPDATQSTDPTADLMPTPVVPLLLLGGGGYHPADTARAWTALTALTAGVELSDALPDTIEQLPTYRPDYKLHTTANASRISEFSSERWVRMQQQIGAIVAGGDTEEVAVVIVGDEQVDDASSR